ncbi:hypothetical protein P4S72_06760 [Vibrio sp. PP-XX7]
MNRTWLAVSVTHQGAQPQALEEAGDRGRHHLYQSVYADPR